MTGKAGTDTWAALRCEDGTELHPLWEQYCAVYASEDLLQRYTTLSSIEACCACQESLKRTLAGAAVVGEDEDDARLVAGELGLCDQSGRDAALRA